MAFFRYTAIDPKGQTVDGTVESSDAVLASRVLTDRGFRNIYVTPPGAATNSNQQTPAYIRTKKASDFDLLIFFSQAAQLIRAGIGPFDAFQQLSQRVRNPDLAKASLEISAGSREGGAISRTVSKYVDLFPHHVVGMIRSGEQGGFLPEALEYLANQYSESNGFKRWFWFLRLVTWQGLLGVILALPLPTAIWEGLYVGTGSAIWTAYLRMLLFPTLPIVGGLMLLAIIARMMLLSSRNLLRRHAMALRIPFGLGPRGRAESIRAFLWTLRNLSKAAVAPGTAWNFAASAVPNATLAIKLAEAGTIGTEKPISESFVRSGLFTAEYGPMIRTAEQTGDIVGTLDRLIQLSSADFDSRQSFVKIGLGSAGCLVILITSGIMTIWLANGACGNLSQRIEEWIEAK